MRPSIAAVILLAAIPSFGQNTDIEALAGLQFNFSNPGARSLGMGGAFIARADDATAAEANPAGLTILRKPELAIDIRDLSVTQSIEVGGTWPYIATMDVPARDLDVSFASAVIPLGDFAVAASYSRRLDFENEIDLIGKYGTPAFYVGPSGLMSEQECATASCQRFQIYPFSTFVDVELESWSLTGAWRRGALALGLGVRYSDFAEETRVRRIDLDRAGQPEFLIEQVNGSRAFGSDHDSDITFVTGVKWDISEAWSAGAVYKKGASFPAPVYAGLASQGEKGLHLMGTPRFHVPDIAGAGASWRPVPLLTLSADVVWVEYSNLTDGFLSVIEFESPDDVESVAGYGTDDGIEPHLGVEYFLPFRVPLALRGGWWREAAHEIAFRGDVHSLHDGAAAVLFPGGDDEDHWAVGFGFSWPQFQVDLAFDRSEGYSVGSLSMVVRR
jgi:long-subunit fatty acid transport protein